MNRDDGSQRFKIDISPYSKADTFCLYHRVNPLYSPNIFFRSIRPDWSPVAYFKTKAEAKKFYDKIKDLPEYLK